MRAAWPERASASRRGERVERGAGPHVHAQAHTHALQPHPAQRVGMQRAPLPCSRSL